MVWIRKISVRIAVLLNILLFTVFDIRSAGVEAGKTEPVQDTVDAKGETEEGENGAEPYIFTVRKLDEVRLEGKASEDFRITNAANDFGIYYVDDGGDLYAWSCWMETVCGDLK